MLIASIPDKNRNSTVSTKGVFDTSSIAFFTYFISVADWKYLESVIFFKYFIHFRPLLPPDDELIQTRNKKNE